MPKGTPGSGGVSAGGSLGDAVTNAFNERNRHKPGSLSWRAADKKLKDAQARLRDATGSQQGTRRASTSSWGTDPRLIPGARQAPQGNNLLTSLEAILKEIVQGFGQAPTTGGPLINLPSLGEPGQFDGIGEDQSPAISPNTSIIPPKISHPAAKTVAKKYAFVKPPGGSKSKKI